MSHAPAVSRPRRRLVIAASVTALVVLALSGVGLYGLLVGPSDAGPAAVPTDPPTSGSTPRPSGEWAAPLPALPHTSDPERYARAFAEAIFTWDTRSGHVPGDYRALVAGDADPSGQETPGLLSDLDGYLPSVTAWRQLAEYATAQQITIQDATVPGSWAEALATSDGQIADGTTAYTLRGIRHRTGTWNGEDVSSDHEVAFTVFVACPPAFDRCHALRLSQLGTPLG